MTQSNQLPIPRDDTEVAEAVPIEVGDLQLDITGVEEAAKELGMTMWGPSKLRACEAMGGAIKKAGVLKIGRSMLMRAVDGASSGLDQCENILGGSSDPEVKASVLQTKFGFVKELRENATAFIKSAELDGSDDAKKPLVKPFGAGQMAGPSIVAQQAVVNVTNTQK